MNQRISFGILTFAGILTSFMLLTGCGGHKEEPKSMAPQQSSTQEELSPTTMDGQAVKGPFDMADVSVYALEDNGDVQDRNGDSVIDDKDLLVSTKTDEVGRFSVKFPSDFSGIVKIVVSGKFKNEASGEEEEGELTSIKAIESGKKHVASVDVFSDLAAESAMVGIKEEGVKLSDALITAHLKIAAHFGLPSDFMDKIPADITEDKVRDPDAVETKKAVISAALTQMALDKKVKVGDIIQNIKKGGVDASLDKDEMKADLSGASHKFLDENEHNKSGLKSTHEKLAAFIENIKAPKDAQDAKIDKLLDKKEELDKKEAALEDKKDDLVEKVADKLDESADKLDKVVSDLEKKVESSPEGEKKTEAQDEIKDIEEKVEAIHDAIDSIQNSEENGGGKGLEVAKAAGGKAAGEEKSDDAKLEETTESEGSTEPEESAQTDVTASPEVISDSNEVVVKDTLSEIAQDAAAITDSAHDLLQGISDTFGVTQDVNAVVSVSETIVQEVEKSSADITIVDQEIAMADEAQSQVTEKASDAVDAAAGASDSQDIPLPSTLPSIDEVPIEGVNE